MSPNKGERAVSTGAFAMLPQEGRVPVAMSATIIPQTRSLALEEGRTGVHAGAALRLSDGIPGTENVHVDTYFEPVPDGYRLSTYLVSDTHAPMEEGDDLGHLFDSCFLSQCDYLELQAKTKAGQEAVPTREEAFREGLRFVSHMREKKQKQQSHLREQDVEWQGVTVCHGQPKWFTWCECDQNSNHQFAKELHCGREWCPSCGAKWSDSHQRRFARWLPKALQIDAMGYFVFTLPPELRKCYRTASELSLLGRQITSLLKSFGFSRGLRRWHFFGEELHIEPGLPSVYHPHLNVLVDGSHLPRHVLDSMRDAWAQLLGVPEAVMHYSYLKWPAQKVHTLKYVTRATFLNIEWDRELAHQLWNFRNTVAFGGKRRWSELPAWSMPPAMDTDSMKIISELYENRCPDCGGKLVWKERLLPQWVVDRISCTVLGAGFRRFNDTS